MTILCWLANTFGRVLIWSTWPASSCYLIGSRRIYFVPVSQYYIADSRNSIASSSSLRFAFTFPDAVVSARRLCFRYVIFGHEKHNWKSFQHSSSWKFQAQPSNSSTGQRNGTKAWTSGSEQVCIFEWTGHVFILTYEVCEIIGGGTV